jgi:hypothetical protein
METTQRIAAVTAHYQSAEDLNLHQALQIFNDLLDEPDWSEEHQQLLVAYALVCINEINYRS